MEATDENIYRAVEREMFEETGLRVKAGAIRYISEHFAAEDQCTMLTVWIACHPIEEEYGPLSLSNMMHDDNIGDVRWWSHGELMALQGKGVGRHIQKEEFWENLDVPLGIVTYLGRTIS